MKKKNVWLAPLIIFVSSIVLAVIIFGISTIWVRKQMAKEHIVPKEYTEADNADTLFQEASFVLEDGRYIEITFHHYPEFIAFISDKDDIEIEYAGNGYNPVSYYNDDYEIMDISEEYFEYMEYSLNGDESGEIITDISMINPDEFYSTEKQYGSRKGSIIISQYDSMKEMKVYDFSSSYLGFENPLDANKEAFLGLFVGLTSFAISFMIVGVGIFAALIVLIVNLCTNPSKKKRA